MTENENKAKRDELVRDVHQLLARALSRVPITGWPITRRAMRGDLSTKGVVPPSSVEEEQLATYCGYAKSLEALEKRIVAYCLGTLGDADSQELRAHACTCDFCRDRLEAAESLRRELEEGRAGEPAGAQRDIPVAATPHAKPAPRPAGTPPPLEVVFRLLRNPQYLGGVILRALRPLDSRSVDLAPVPVATRGVKSPAPEPRRGELLQSSLQGQADVGPLRVGYVVARLEDGYQLELQIVEADGQPTTRELLIERSVRGEYAGAEPVVGGKYAIPLPAQFSPLELTFYERNVALGPMLVIREETV